MELIKGTKVYYDGSLIGRNSGMGGSKGTGVITKTHLTDDWVEVTLDKTGYKIAMSKERMKIATNTK